MAKAGGTEEHKKATPDQAPAKGGTKRNCNGNLCNFRICSERKPLVMDWRLTL